MSPERRRRTRQNVDLRLESSRARIEYGEDDEALVRATRDLILPHADTIAAAVYDHLLNHRETAAYFTTPDGMPDRAHLNAREASLKEWLLFAIEAPLDEQAATYLTQVGLAHAGRGRRGPPGVKGRYMVSTMSFVQTALVGLLEPQIADRTELLATIVAWSKLLMVHLDLFLAAYSSAERNPHWY